MSWVLVAFLANGTAQFLQKYLHMVGLGHYQQPALLTLYLSGTLFAVFLLLGFRGRVGRSEITYGVGVGLMSYAGNAALLGALGRAPAFVVFPLVVGGPILTVAILTRLLFNDHLGTLGKLGIFSGFLSVILLTLG